MTTYSYDTAFVVLEKEPEGMKYKVYDKNYGDGMILVKEGIESIDKYNDIVNNALLDIFKKYYGEDFEWEE